MSSTVIEGGHGSLEIRIALPGKKIQKSVNHDENRHANHWVVLSHPHPQFGGTMDNKVVTTMERTFQSLGYGTVTYNFRGIGLSEGHYDGGKGEQQDLAQVVLWLKQTYEVEKLILAGFSFGSYIALKQCQALQADAICTVAPAVGMYDFSDIEVSVPWVLIQGGEDEIIPAKEVLDWAFKQENQPDIYLRSQASHFFHRQLVWLKQVLLLEY